MQIVIDSWEGNWDLDEKMLLDNGVASCIVRLNDMNGGHHMDARFTQQWEQSRVFPARSLYFVYNPWVTGVANFSWLAAHAPPDTPLRLFIDVEVIYPGYSPQNYAAELATFIRCVKGWGHTPVIYTGSWFLPYLTAWPKGVEYWWARYPSAIQGDGTTITTDWPTVRAKMEALGWNPVALPYTCPGTVRLWQMASRYILPGTAGLKIDINQWPGTVQELEEWMEGAQREVAHIIYLEVARDAPGQSGNSQVRNGPANDGTDQFAIESKQVVGVYDVSFYVPGSPDDITGYYYHDNWIRVYDLSKCTLEGLRLPIPTAPGWPASAYMSPAEWAAIKSRDLLANVPSSWLWIEKSTLRPIVTQPPPPQPGDDAAALLVAVKVIVEIIRRL